MTNVMKFYTYYPPTNRRKYGLFGIARIIKVIVTDNKESYDCYEPNINTFYSYSYDNVREIGHRELLDSAGYRKSKITEVFLFKIKEFTNVHYIKLFTKK